MPRRLLVALLIAGVLVSGCSKLERLSIIRPSAARGDYTQVAPTYDVTGKTGRPRKTDSTQLLMSASDLYQQGDFTRAQALAERALKAEPRSGDAHTVLGAIAEARGEAKLAGAHYGKAIEIAPNTGIYANNYGHWLCANGRAGESLAWFDRAVADPDYPTRERALTNAGGCAQKAGQPQRAEVSWRQALALDPASVPALSGMATMKFASGEFLDARAFTERWLTMVPGDPDGLRLAVQVEEKLGDNVAASRYLSRLQAIPSGSGTAPRAQ